MVDQFKVVIIDDNQLIVESLESTISWKELGLNVAGHAYDGMEGKDLIQRVQPDIIITDISMPGMDGLTMVKDSSDFLQKSKVIFITGYDRFQYASRAIKLSAFDYILKPIDNTEVSATLTRAIESLRKERNQRRRAAEEKVIIQRAQFLASLTGMYSPYARDDLWDFLDNTPDQYFFIVAETTEDITRPVLERFEFVQFPQFVEVVSTVLDDELVLFCSVKQTDLSFQTIARSVSDKLLGIMESFTFAVSDIHSDPSEYLMAYHESRSTLLWHYVSGRRAAIEFYDVNMLNADGNERMKKLEAFCSMIAKKRKKLGAGGIWNQIIEVSHGRIRIIRLLLLLITNSILKYEDVQSPLLKSIDEMTFELTAIEDRENAKEWLFNFVEKLHITQKSPSSTLVREVLDYVNLHVTEGMMLDSIAKKFFVSPNYLSALIHKETGITYRQHVLNAKMKVAKQMLDDTRMSVEDIAYAINYENYISFYNVFKKIEGMSPTEYRFRKR